MKPPLNAVDTLNYSASLVENISNVKLSNGDTLAEGLTIEGIPFWDMFSTELAHSHIPTVLASNASPGSVINRLKPGLIRFKHIARDFIHGHHNTDGCLTWPTGQTFLCINFTKQMYRDVLEPVVSRLATRQYCHVVVLSNQHADGTNIKRNVNCEYHTLWQHWSEGTKHQINTLKHAINQKVRNLQLYDLLLQKIPEKDQHLLTNFKCLFNRFLRAYLPLIVPQVVVARHILKDHRPAIVITPDTADSRTRVYALLCRLMNIPCMDVQFGLAGDEGIEWRFLASDCVAVWGEASKEAMLKQKVSENRIVITGSPRHDCLVNTTISDKISKRAILDVPENSVMIVLASTYYVKTHDKYSDPNILRSMKHAVFDAADKVPNIFLIVKPHPVENVRETRSLYGRSNNIIFVDQQSDIRELTKACDAFISFGSTATIDALIAGKLTICPVFPGWVFSDLFKFCGATLVPESGEEILKIFRMISNGSYHDIIKKLEAARQEFLRRYVYLTDGMAAARVEELAVKMAGLGRT